jgi:hypothetical protein
LAVPIFSFAATGTCVNTPPPDTPCGIGVNYTAKVSVSFYLFGYGGYLLILGNYSWYHFGSFPDTITLQP